MRRTEIRIAGFGGQGVVLSATIIGRAACIYANHYAAMTQSFIVSDEPILYPTWRAPIS